MSDIFPAAAMPRRVLLVYSTRPPIIDDLAAAFARLGVDTDYVLADENHWFDRWVIRRVNKQMHNFRLLPKSKALFADHPLAHQNFRSAKLAQKMSEFAPDLVFLVRGINFNHAVLAQAPTLFGWWVEREERVKEAIAESALFDWYFFISRSAVEAAAQAGYAHASYLGHAVNPERFCRQPDAVKQYDACFVGNWSPHRQCHVEAMLEVTPNVAIYGRKWRRNNLMRPQVLKAVKGSWIDGDDLNRLYNQSRVVVNVTNWGAGSGKARSGMNMRIFEVPASGAFLLTDESREMEEFVTPGQHIGVYEGCAGLAAQLRHFLANEAERETIADAGSRRVRECYTYDATVQTIVDVYRTQREKADVAGR